MHAHPAHQACRWHVPQWLSVHTHSAVQAAQVRKTCYMADEAPHAGSPPMYSPDTHHSCTIHAGTFVQQVQGTPDSTKSCHHRRCVKHSQQSPSSGLLCDPHTCHNCLQHLLLEASLSSVPWKPADAIAGMLLYCGLLPVILW